MKKRLYKLSKIEKGLQVFLFEDQIRALTLAKRSRRAVWSHDTLLTARKIRCAVGVKGYEYLRELGYPLPSYRTLCNRLEPKMMVTTSMQDELAELGLGIITACDSPEGNVTSDEGLIGVMTWDAVCCKELHWCRTVKPAKGEPTAGLAEDVCLLGEIIPGCCCCILKPFA